MRILADYVPSFMRELDAEYPENLSNQVLRHLSSTTGFIAFHIPQLNFEHPPHYIDIAKQCGVDSKRLNENYFILELEGTTYSG